jgi:hypothetical protein
MPARSSTAHPSSPTCAANLPRRRADHAWLQAWRAPSQDGDHGDPGNRPSPVRRYRWRRADGDPYGDGRSGSQTGVAAAPGVWAMPAAARGTGLSSASADLSGAPLGPRARSSVITEPSGRLWRDVGGSSVLRTRQRRREHPPRPETWLTDPAKKARPPHGGGEPRSKAPQRMATAARGVQQILEWTGQGGIIPAR